MLTFLKIAPVAALIGSLCVSPLSFGFVLAADSPTTISFDLPSVAVAVPANPTSDTGLNQLSSTGGQCVRINLRLSSLVGGDQVPNIDRWMIRCVPRHAGWKVLEYSPQTETGSDHATPISVKSMDEASDSFGLATDASYGRLANVHLGADQGQKQSLSEQYDRHAPLHAVTAAGTIQRGRGVYFKLRWTSQQVLEGEKQFAITFSVPQDFRSGLMDVSVVASGRPQHSDSLTDSFSKIPVLGGGPTRNQTLGEANFVVAIHAEGDVQARDLARDFADAETTLRRKATDLRSQNRGHTVGSLLRHVAAKFNADTVDVHSNWLPRLIMGEADPYTDPVISKLPTEYRVATLDYCDARRALTQLKTRRTQDIEWSKKLGFLQH